jgi:hypothetical protein
MPVTLAFGGIDSPRRGVRMARAKSADWLERLTRLVSPPQAPVNAGPPEARTAVETALGTRLPDDLFEFACVYGSGEFRTDEYSLVVAVANPFDRHFVRSTQRMAKGFKGFWPGYDVYPTSPGLFPCGTGNGPRDLFFYTEGDPEHWPLLTSISLSGLIRLDLSLSEFVSRLLDGTLPEVGESENQWFKARRGQFRFETWS